MSLTTCFLFISPMWIHVEFKKKIGISSFPLIFYHPAEMYIKVRSLGSTTVSLTSHILIINWGFFLKKDNDEMSKYQTWKNFLNHRKGELYFLLWKRKERTSFQDGKQIRKDQLPTCKPEAKNHRSGEDISWWFNRETYDF